VVEAKQCYLDAATLAVQKAGERSSVRTAVLIDTGGWRHHVPVVSVGHAFLTLARRPRPLTRATP
jgi:hypothetical protein